MSFNANLVAGLLVTALCSASCGVSASGAGQQGAPANTIAQPGTQQILNGNEVVLIDSINGVASSSHATTISAHPGDVIQLSADVFDTTNGTLTPEIRDAEEFQWSANDGQGICDASQATTCLDQSNFEVTDYGVNYYVPNNITQQVTITVWNNTTGQSVDTLILTNADYAQIVTPPTTVVSDPAQYPYPQFNSDYALAGQGRWVVIEGTRYWVPYSSGSDWVPYSNGYWTWVANDGWTWVSYDSWGWYTDHYGVWRHHREFGWIWIPMDDGIYRASTVTWFFDTDYVGWYPYYNSYPNAYRHGYAQGFDDGYWAGYRAGSYYDRDDFHPGFSCVHYGDFSRDNMWHVRVDIDNSRNVYRGSYGGHRYGDYPGAGDRDGSWNYMRGHAGYVPVTSWRDHDVGGRNIRGVNPVYPVPGEYRHDHDGDDRFNGRPAPIGSQVHRGDDGHSVWVPPTSNGRGISHPPVQYDPHSGESHPMPPRTQNPAQPNPSNPVYQPGQRPPYAGHGHDDHGGSGNHGGGGNNGGGDHGGHGGNGGGGNNPPPPPPNNGGGNNGGGDHGGHGGNGGGGNNPPPPPPNNGGGNNGGGGHGGNGGGGNNPPPPPPNNGGGNNGGGGHGGNGGGNNGGGGNNPPPPPPNNGGGNNGGGGHGGNGGGGNNGGGDHGGHGGNGGGNGGGNNGGNGGGHGGHHMEADSTEE